MFEKALQKSHVNDVFSSVEDHFLDNYCSDYCALSELQKSVYTGSSDITMHSNFLDYQVQVCSLYESDYDDGALPSPANNYSFIWEEYPHSQEEYSITRRLFTIESASTADIMPYNTPCDYTGLEDALFLDYEEVSEYYYMVRPDIYYNDYSPVTVDKELVSNYEIVDTSPTVKPCKCDDNKYNSDDDEDGIEEIERLLTILDQHYQDSNKTVFSIYQTMEEDGDLLEEESTDYQRVDESFYDERYVEVFEGINSSRYEFMYQLQSAY